MDPLSLHRNLLRRHQTFTNREQHQFGRAVDIHLLHQVGAVDGDGVHAKVEQCGDILVRLPLGDQL